MSDINEPCYMEILDDVDIIVLEVRYNLLFFENPALLEVDYKDAYLSLPAAIGISSRAMCGGSFGNTPAPGYLPVYWHGASAEPRGQSEPALASPPPFGN